MFNLHKYFIELGFNAERISIFHPFIFRFVNALAIDNAFLLLWIGEGKIHRILYSTLQLVLIVFVLFSLSSILIMYYASMFRDIKTYSHKFKNFYIGFSIGSILWAGISLIPKIRKPSINFYDLYLLFHSLFFASLFALERKIVNNTDFACVSMNTDTFIIQ